MIAFVVRELSIDFPAVNLRLYKSFNLAMGNIMNLIIGLIITGSVFIFPLFTQVSLGWTATQTGAFMIPGAMATAVGMIAVSRIVGGGANPKVVIMIGLAMMSSFLILMSFAGPDSNSSNFFWPFILRGIGAAFMMMPNGLDKARQDIVLDVMAWILKPEQQAEVCPELGHTRLEADRLLVLGRRLCEVAGRLGSTGIRQQSLKLRGSGLLAESTEGNGQQRQLNDGAFSHDRFTSRTSQPTECFEARTPGLLSRSCLRSRNCH